MKEKILLLLSEIERADGRQAGLHERLERSWERFLQEGDYSLLVETAFYLNQLYSGYERVLLETAEVFESSLDSMSWHKSLLERMRLDLEGIRPAFISEDTCRCLNELRAFRHFFRHAYDVDLEAEKIALVVKKASRLKELWAADSAAFRAFLRRLAAKS